MSDIAAYAAVIFYSRPKLPKAITLGAAEYNCEAIELAAGE